SLCTAVRRCLRPPDPPAIVAVERISSGGWGQPTDAVGKRGGLAIPYDHAVLFFEQRRQCGFRMILRNRSEHSIPKSCNRLNQQLAAQWCESRGQITGSI